MSAYILPLLAASLAAALVELLAPKGDGGRIAAHVRMIAGLYLLVALLNPLRFLREREIVHFQRFGECLNILQSCTTAGATVTVPEKDCCCEEK